MRAAAIGQAVARARAPSVEWPSLALAGGIYGGFLGLTWFNAAIPLWALVPALVWTIAWHSSMQHEFIHGHPTRWRKVNRLIASVPLSLWLPFEAYRATHLVHHRDERLTDPYDDPESRYLTPADWEALGPLARRMLNVQSCLAGRLLVGPAWNVGHFLRDELARVVAGDRFARVVWLRHALLCAVVLAWTWGVCRIDPLFYVFALVYPSTALLLVRSFAEHRASEGVAERTAIVENAPVLGLLYLYNNLHAAHHEAPTLPWYALPRWYALNRARLVADNGNLVYDGYGEVARRFFLTAHDVVPHPMGGVPRDG